MGIIDIKDDQDDEFFSNIEDDKLPILKNTYYKKKRGGRQRHTNVMSIQIDLEGKLQVIPTESGIGEKNGGELPGSEDLSESKQMK